MQMVDNGQFYQTMLLLYKIYKELKHVNLIIHITKVDIAKVKCYAN